MRAVIWTVCIVLSSTSVALALPATAQPQSPSGQQGAPPAEAPPPAPAQPPVIGEGPSTRTSQQQQLPGDTDVILQEAQQIPMNNILCHYSVEQAHLSVASTSNASNVVVQYDGNVSFECRCEVEVKNCIFEPTPEEVDDELQSTGRTCPGTYSIINENNKLQTACSEQKSPNLAPLAFDLSPRTESGALSRFLVGDVPSAGVSCQAYCDGATQLLERARTNDVCGLIVPPAILVRQGVCDIPRIKMPNPFVADIIRQAN